MSGICGLIALNGKPVGQTDLAGMLSTLERRGPDGTHGWFDGSQALGHTSLATTPEALNEQLPITHSPSECTITADARLDNRAELFVALDIKNTSMGDGELILRSYLKWGTDCANHLLGDFAFALWDARKETLFCARDLTGMRQLNYHYDAGKLFAFATEPQAIVQHSEILGRTNEARIADFLEDLEAYDLTSTFYVGIQRLPPGHALLLRQGSLRIWRYDELTPQPTLNLPDSDAYADAFREVFAEAVKVRLRAPSPVGSMLSGGMDSGSVSAVAATLLKQSNSAPLDTFSAVGTDPDCPETRAIMAALSIDSISPNLISVDGLDEYRTELEKLIEESAEPFDAHMTLPIAIYLAAHRAGHKVMLDGVGGDTTLGTQNMVTWNLRRGRIGQAWREARGEEHFWEYPVPAMRSFVQSAGQIIVPQKIRELRHSYLSKRAKHDPENISLLSDDFAARVGLKDRIRTNAAHTAYPRGDTPADRQRRVLHPFVTVARERYDRVASALAIEPRDPFLDRRVLEFCLSLPADQLQRNGWPKYILRKATNGMLPDAVRWRTGKQHLGWDFTIAVEGRRPPKENGEIIRSVKRFVNETALANVKSLPDDESAFEANLSIRYLFSWISTRDESE